MKTYQRRLKQTKTDVYELKVATWLGGDTLTAASVSCPGGGVTVGAVTFSGAVISVLLTGVTVGEAGLEWQFQTATRNDCAENAVIVIEDC